MPCAIESWFAQKQWQPLNFQREAWSAYTAGQSGLIHAPTGLGKTLAAWLGPVRENLHTADDSLRVLWITPLRALAADTMQALQQPLTELGLPLTVAMRTGDTTTAQRAKLKKKLPFALITTPESLSLLLSYDDSRERFGSLQAVICDEWHELMGTKRGVQTELCLARLRRLAPGLRTWGLSATLGNLDEAMQVLLGGHATQGRLIHAPEKKELAVETILPASIDRFPWSGHLGHRLLEEVVRRIESTTTTLLFTNTRNQTEVWYQELITARPDWAESLFMHHGSLDREVREEVEAHLKNGTAKCVVCTSSLDLGVDFSPVAQVIQLGSPKGIARLRQRAGRSGHRPGETSRIYGVPTNAFELVEFAAARRALEQGLIEARRPLRLPLDVLLQHLVTIAVGEGFFAEPMWQEVRSTHAYADLTEREWQWLLDFITTGGALRAYPEYQKVKVSEDGRYQVTEPRLARQHRMNLGTIVSAATVQLKMANGKKLGTVEETFISRIKVGQVFIFGGRRLELVRHRGLMATVKAATKKRARGEIPSWQGGKSPLSSELATAVNEQLSAFSSQNRSQPLSPELTLVAPILELQAQWSHLPRPEELLIEHTQTREGHHLFLYPFAGRLVNEGIGLLLAYRLTRESAQSIQVTPNDYGVELFSDQSFDIAESDWPAFFTTDRLMDDLLGCLNTAELGRHQFREVARVAGLVIQGFPGQEKPLRSLQTSSGLLYDVLARYDPQNLLLQQAQREVLERQLEYTRLEETLRGMQQRRLCFHLCPRLTPMAFPLWADSISTHLSTEDFATRLGRMLDELETAADRP